MGVRGASGKSDKLQFRQEFPCRNCMNCNQEMVGTNRSVRPAASGRIELSEVQIESTADLICRNGIIDGCSLSAFHCRGRLLKAGRRGRTIPACVRQRAGLLPRLFRIKRERLFLYESPVFLFCLFSYLLSGQSRILLDEYRRIRCREIADTPWRFERSFLCPRGDLRVFASRGNLAGMDRDLLDGTHGRATSNRSQCRPR